MPRKGEGLSLSVSQPLAPTPAERTDDQANLIRHFDPVNLSLEQIESLQQLLAQAAATRRALEHQPEYDPAIPYLRESEVHDALELGTEEDHTGTYHRGGEAEIDWRNLDPQGLAKQAEIDAVIESMKAEAAARDGGQQPRLVRPERSRRTQDHTPKPTRSRKAKQP